MFILVPKNTNLQKYKKIALSLITDINPKKILEVRGEDIPSWIVEFSKKGKKAIGLTGEDLYREYCLEQRKYSRDIVVLKRINWYDEKALFKKPTLCLIGPKNKSLENLEKNITVCISAKYKKIAKKYLNFLEVRDGFIFKKIYVNGSTEQSCSEGISDLIIDIVYTGSTIAKYGLTVYDKIMQSDFLILSSNVKNRSIIFDMDGVLVDTRNSYGMATKKTIEFFLRKKISIDEIQKIKGQGYNNEWDCCEELLLKYNVKVKKAEIIEKFQEFLEKEKLMNNEKCLIKKTTLEKLSSKAKLAILTGRPKNETIFTLKKFSLLNYFDVIVTRDDLPEEKQKPNPLGLELVIKKLKTNDNLYIGDTPADALMANLAKVKFAGVLPIGYSEKFKKKLIGAEFVMKNINEIKDIFERGDKKNDKNIQIG